MELVPAHLAELAIGPHDGLWRCGVQLDQRTEVDLDLVAGEIDDTAAETIRRYAARCRELWDRWDSDAPRGSYVATRRIVVDRRQVDRRDNGGGRDDLTAELDALEQVAGLAELVEELTGSAPDIESVERAAAAMRGQLEVDGNLTTVTVHVDTGVDWPLELGGAASRGEVQRRITVAANHAKWRDRRSRRLVSVTVEVDEIWADPDTTD